MQPVIHHLWCFGTEIPSSGSHYNKGIYTDMPNPWATTCRSWYTSHVVYNGVHMLDDMVMVELGVHKDRHSTKTAPATIHSRCDKEFPQFLIKKPTRCTNFSSLFLEWNSTCFGQFLCPSSGVFHCTHRNGICHTGLLVPSWSCSQAVSKSVWHIPLLCVQ